MENKKKCLFIFNGPLGNGMSGGDNHSIRLANLLSAKKYEVKVAIPKNTYEKYFKKVKIILNKRKLPRKYYSNYLILFFYYITRVLFVMKEIKKNDYDFIVSSSHLFFDSFPLLFYPRSRSVTFIHHIISDQKRSFFHLLVTSFLEQASFQIFKIKKTLIFVDSLKVKNDLVLKYNFKSNLIFLTKNGVDLNYIKSIKVREKKYDFVFCGRLNQTKGIYDLLEIVKFIKEKKSVSLIVIGSGPEKRKFTYEIKKNKLDKNIFLTGFLSEQEKIKKIKESKVFLLPSHEEGWGIVIGEALAAGLPVVAYKLPDIQEIWQEHCVWVSLYDYTQFSEKALTALSVNRRNINKKFIQGLNWDAILETEEKNIKKYMNY